MSARIFAAATAIATLLACSRWTAKPATYPAVVDLADSAKHPRRAAGFERDQVIAYDAELANTSTAYGLLDDDLQVAATVDVVPREGAADLAERFAAEKKTTVELHPGARMRKEEDVSFEKKGVSHPARKMLYEFEATFRGQRQQLHAELFVWAAGDRWVIVRSLAPSWQKKRASAKTLELLDAIDWTS